MNTVTTIGLDTAKQCFQAHGVNVLRYLHRLAIALGAFGEKGFSADLVIAAAYIIQAQSVV